MKNLIFFIFPFLHNIKKGNLTIMRNYACIEDEDMCVIEVVSNYDKPSILKKYLSEEIINDYEECILSSNEACEAYWYIDENYTQWKIDNGTLSYLDKNPLKWIHIKD